MAKRKSKVSPAETAVPKIIELLKEENELLDEVSHDVYARGEDYFRRGAVRALKIAEDRVTARVDGTDRYEVTIELEYDELTAVCNCPYDYDGPCKHIVAVVLACQQMGTEPSDFFREQIKALGKTDLRKLLLTLAKDPSVEASIRAALQKRDENTRTPAGLARRVNQILKGLREQRSDYALMSSGYEIARISDILDEAMQCSEAGGEQKLLRQLEAITRPVIQAIPQIPDASDELAEFLWPLSEAWVRTLLRAKLTGKQRNEWAEVIASWQSALEPIGLDSDLEPVAWAALLGWSDEHLLKIIGGKTKKRMPWAGDEHARLVLAGVLIDELIGQGRLEEAMLLARVEGSARDQLRAARAAGKIDEAISIARKNPVTGRETLEFCVWLASNGRNKEAIELSRASLAYKDRNAVELARWLRGVAREFGDLPLALEAAERAVLLSTTLEDYKWLKSAAGEKWSAIKPGIIDKIQEKDHFGEEGVVDILLHEGMVREAFKIAQSSREYTNMHRAIEIAIETDTEFAASTALDEANDIMDKANSSIYHHANTWLRHAKRAFLASGRTAEWDMVLTDLLHRHRLKTSLVPYLKGLKEG